MKRLTILFLAAFLCLNYAGITTPRMILDGSGSTVLAQGDPATIGHIDDGGFASGVYVSGAYTYPANGGDGLRIYDITDPSAP